MRLHLCIAFIGSVSNTVEHTVTTSLSSNRNKFHLLIQVSVSRNSCTNIPPFAAFRHLFDGDQLAFSFYFVFAYLPVTSYPISLSFENNKLEGRNRLSIDVINAKSLRLSVRKQSNAKTVAAFLSNSSANATS